MQVKTVYVIDKPHKGRFEVTTSTGNHVHKNVGRVYKGQKNLTVCDIQGRAIARYPVLLVSSHTHITKG
jgi:hypothetical protein